MAKFAFQFALGQNLSETGTTFSVVTGNIGVGVLAVCAIGSDNAGTTDAAGADNIVGITDTGGNTWTLAGGYRNGQGAAQGGAHASIWYSKIVTGLGGSGSITITNATTTYSRCASVATYTLPSGGDISVVGNVGAAGDAGVDPSCPISGLASDEYLFVGCAADETTTNLPTTLTGFSNAGGNATSGGSAALNMAHRQYYAIETATGKTFTPATSADAAAVLVAFKCTVGVTGDLAATETGSDTAALTGELGRILTLGATETGSDTASVVGLVNAGGEALIANETDGAGFDFLTPYDPERVAVKVGGVVTEYYLNNFVTAGTSTKQVYDPNGTLVWSPHNRLLQSQTFDVSPWGVGQTTVAANATVAPDGTTTADKIIEIVHAGNVYFVVQSITAPLGTFSVYAKAAGRNYIMLCPFPFSDSAVFDLVNGVVMPTTSLGTKNPDAVIQSVGNGWWRCSISITDAAITSLRVHLHNGSNHGYAGDGTSGVYLWGAQVNRGPDPTSYVATTTAERNGPALDYDPITHEPLGMLVEPAATNRMLQSAAGRPGFLWSGNTSTRTTSTERDPSGGFEAIQVICTGHGGLNLLGQLSGLTIGTTYTASIWCKGIAGQQTYHCNGQYD